MKTDQPRGMYRIGDLIRRSPFSRQMIHNYTIMGLIREAGWTEGGHRLYDESAFKRLGEIARLKREGHSLADIRRILGEVETDVPPLQDDVEKHLCRIGEIGRLAGLSRQTVHNYTVMGLIHEAGWTEGGHRLYDHTTLERLDEIKSLRRAGYPLRTIGAFRQGVHRAANGEGQ